MYAVYYRMGSHWYRAAGLSYLLTTAQGRCISYGCPTRIVYGQR